MRPLQPALFVALFAFLFSSASLFSAEGSREVLIADAPAWVTPLSVPREADTPGEAVSEYYLLVETQTNVLTRETYRHNAYRILDEAGLQGAQLTLAFDPEYETLTLHQVQLLRGEAVLNRLDQAKIQVLQRENDLEYLLYDGKLSAHLILDDVRVGDVVEVAYTRRGRNPVFGDAFLDALTLDWGMPVKHLRHRVIHPPERSLAYRTVGVSKIVAQTATTPHGRELIWEGRDLPAVVYDRNVPSWHVTNAYVQLTEFPSWAAVVEWALPLYAEPETVAPLIAEKLETIRANGKNSAEQALLALRFVQEEIRYLGIEQGAGSHRPSLPDAVIARRFGDCKDKARLLVSLFRQLGFEAVPVLVDSYRRQAVAELLPSPYAFNHVIVLLRLDGAEYLLDPTLSYQRGDIARRHTARYKSGLLVEPGVRRLSSWPESGNDLAQIEAREVFEIPGLEADTRLRVHTVYSNRAAERMRSYFTTTKRDDVGKSYVDFYARYYPEIAVEGQIQVEDDQQANRIVVTENYTIPRIFVESTTENVREASFFATALNEQKASPGGTRRTAPLAVAHPEDITHVTEIKVFDDWTITPKTTQVKDDAFTFDRSERLSGRTIELHSRWRSHAEYVSPENFAVHSRNLARVNELSGYSLTYNTGVTTEAAGFRLNLGMVSLAAFTFTLLAAASVVVWRRRAPVPPPPPPPPLPVSEALSSSSSSPIPPPPPPMGGNFSADDGLTGLGGWLILVAIGVVLRPVWAVVSLVQSANGYFNQTVWDVATDPAGGAHLPMFDVLAPIELILGLTRLVGAGLLVLLFFNRRRAFPALMIGLLALECLMSFFAVGVGHVFKLEDKEQMDAVQDVVRSVAAAAIWIPYCLVSKRVKLTFTR